MARMSGSVLGIPAGKIGGVVFHTRYQELWVRKACTEFHKSETEGSRMIRERMRPMSEFGAIVRSIPELYPIWKKSNVKAKAVYHMIQKYNAKLFNPDRPTVNNRIVPGYGFLCPVSEIEFDRHGIFMKIEIGRPKEEIIPLINKFVAIYVVCLFEPTDGEKKYFELFYMRKDLGLCETKAEMEVDFPFEDEESKLVASYKRGIVWLEIIPLDEKGNTLSYSDYYSREFEFGG